MQRKRVLVVDDEDDIREVAAASLELTYGWEVITASSGQEAIAKAIDAQPDAILLDVMMPEMDGPTVFRWLHSHVATQHIPVILLTAKIQTADRQRYLGLGVQGMLAKPFDPLTLAERVAETLHWVASSKMGG